MLAPAGRRHVSGAAKRGANQRHSFPRSTGGYAPHVTTQHVTLAAVTLVGLAMLVWLIASLASAAF